MEIDFNFSGNISSINKDQFDLMINEIKLQLKPVEVKAKSSLSQITIKLVTFYEINND